MAGNETYIVYSKENCSYCQQAKNLLLMRGKTFEVKMLDVDYTLDEYKERFPEQRTFPMVVLKTKQPREQYGAVNVTFYNIGGFAELKEHLK